MSAPGAPVQGAAGALRFRIGLGASLLIGFVSSFFGVGGGFIFVPLFVFFLKMPARQATANSQLILIVVSATALATGFFQGNLHFDLPLMACLVGGVLAGAQLGSALAERLHSAAVLGLLAALMAVAGVRLVGF